MEKTLDFSSKPIFLSSQARLGVNSNESIKKNLTIYINHSLNIRMHHGGEKKGSVGSFASIL